MTNATVTIKVSTTEFELIRKSLEASKKTCAEAMMSNNDTNSPEFKVAREMAGQYADLIRRLA